MALHGEIKVNGNEIGHWSARRLHADVREVCSYRYEVLWRDLSGNPNKVTGFLDWPYGNAISLASEIMRRAAGERGLGPTADEIIEAALEPPC
jgi:ribosomal protein S4